MIRFMSYNYNVQTRIMSLHSILCIPFILSGSPNEGGLIGTLVSQEDRDQTVTEKNEAPLSNEVHIGNNIVTLLLLPC